MHTNGERASKYRGKDTFFTISRMRAPPSFEYHFQCFLLFLSAHSQRHFYLSRLLFFLCMKANVKLHLINKQGENMLNCAGFKWEAQTLRRKERLLIEWALEGSEQSGR